MGLSVLSQALFLLALVWCGYWVLSATGSRLFILVLAILGAAHWVLAENGFYLNSTDMPPTQALLLVPAVLTLAALIVLPGGRQWMRSADLTSLTALHILRLPVELVLHEAGERGLVPLGMTYSGHNFDIVSGLSAVIMTAWLRSNRPPGRSVLIVWNIVCLGLLLAVVVTAVGAIPSAVQAWNFVNPNVLVLRAPWVLLPGVLVPTVLWAHVTALVKLLGPRAAGVGAVR